MYFTLKPECSGKFGRRTLYGGELDARPPEIFRFEYEFTEWPIDPLLELQSLYILTNALANALQSFDPRPTGFTLDKVMPATTIECRRAHPTGELPEYKWLKINGKAGKDDFGMSRDHELVVSERIFMILKPLLKKCEVSAYVSEGSTATS